MARKRTLYLPVMIATAGLMAYAVALLAVSQKKAEATFSGKNGRIAYQGYDGNDYEIYTINSRGGDKFQVTNNNGYDTAPSYSPDGKRFAYMARDQSESGISTIKVGGGVSSTSPTTIRTPTTTLVPNTRLTAQRSSSRPTTTKKEPGSPRSTSTGATRLRSPSATPTAYTAASRLLPGGAGNGWPLRLPQRRSR